MSKTKVDVAKKIKALEKKKADRARRKGSSTRLVAAPAKRRKRRRKRKASKLAGPVTIRKIPRSYAEAKALYGTAWYKEWREFVFARDQFTCQMCGQKGRSLEAHHIRPKYMYPELTLDKDNGITLCKICHQDRVTRYEHRFAFIFDRIVRLNK